MQASQHCSKEPQVPGLSQEYGSGVSVKAAPRKVIPRAAVEVSSNPCLGSSPS